MAKRLAKQILILIGCFLVVGPIRQPLAQQNMAAVAGVVDVAGAVRLYFARNGKYLAWPSLLPDPEISEILTDTGGTPGTVMVECFKNLTVRGGHGALLPYEYRAFHQGRLPAIPLDFSTLKNGKTQVPENKDTQSKKNSAGGQEKPNPLQLPPTISQGPPPEPFSVSIAKAVLSSMGPIRLGGREPLDRYVELDISRDLETQTIVEQDLINQIEGPDFDKGCLNKLMDDHNFIITGLVRGRLRLKWAEVRSDKTPRLVAVGPPSGWVRNEDGSIEMKERRVLAFFPHRLKFSKGHAQSMRPISKDQWQHISWNTW